MGTLSMTDTYKQSKLLPWNHIVECHHKIVDISTIVIDIDLTMFFLFDFVSGSQEDVVVGCVLFETKENQMFPSRELKCQCTNMTTPHKIPIQGWVRVANLQCKNFKYMMIQRWAQNK